VATATGKDVALAHDKDSGRDTLEVSLPLGANVYDNAEQAEFSYKLYERNERAQLSGDTLQVKKT
jgi:hypothetical protein